jgi:hypothetical protein
MDMRVPYGEWTGGAYFLAMADLERTPCERTALTLESFGIPVLLPKEDVSEHGI